MKFSPSNLINNKAARKLLIFLMTDILLFFLSFMIAFWIDSAAIGIEQKTTFAQTMLLCIPCAITTIFVMFAGRIYSVLWQYAGTVDLLRLIVVGVISLACGVFYRTIYALIGTHSNSFTSVHPSLVVIAYIFFFALVLACRLSRKFWTAARLKSIAKNPQNKVIIYGAGSNGSAMIRRMHRHGEEGYMPVAIIDDDPNKKDSMIEGVKVYGGRESIGSAIKEFGADVIAICISTLSQRELRAIFEEIKQYNIRIMVSQNLRDGNSAVNAETVSIRSIKIEDLLHREEHTMNRALVDGIIKDKTVMVTGGAGSIGSELVRQALLYECKKLIIFDNYENGMFSINEELKDNPKNDGRYVLEIGSVRDRNKLKEVMERHKPQIVFHAAAYKHVPMMEIAADEAVKNNVMGTKNVIEQCNDCGVEKFVLISTDKAINPANVMGATKRSAELCLQALSTRTKTKLAAVRFGNVLGSSGSVIPTFIRQINEGGPVTVTDKEMKRYFMTIPEAVRLVLQAGALAEGGEVFVLDMGEPVRIYDLACDLIRMTRQVPNRDIQIKITGLRPGEKMFEELSYSGENADKTVHKDIFLCKLEKIDVKQTEESLSKIFKAAESGDKDLTENLLFKLVPSAYRENAKAKTKN